VISPLAAQVLKNEIARKSEAYRRGIHEYRISWAEMLRDREPLRSAWIRFKRGIRGQEMEFVKYGSGQRSSEQNRRALERTRRFGMERIKTNAS
jgi:hypothetical protein